MTTWPRRWRCRCCRWTTSWCCPAWSCRSALRCGRERRGPRGRRRGHDRGEHQVLLVPRLDGKYATVGTLAEIEQVGRLPGGERAAVVRGTEAGAHRDRHHRPRRGAVGRGDRRRRVPDHRPDARAGQGVPGAGDDHPAAARRVAGGRHGAADHRPVGARRPRRATPPTSTEEQKIWLLETSDVTERLEKLLEWSREHLPSSTSPRRSARTSRRAWRSSSGSSCCASSWPRSARSWPSWTASPRPRRRTTAPASRPPTCRRRSARPR